MNLPDKTPLISRMRDALLDIKRLAEKSGDSGSDPFALLDLIADHTRVAIRALEQEQQP